LHESDVAKLIMKAVVFPKDVLMNLSAVPTKKPLTSVKLFKLMWNECLGMISRSVKSLTVLKELTLVSMLI
jgi:hypothetical protein